MHSELESIYLYASPINCGLHNGSARDVISVFSVGSKPQTFHKKFNFSGKISEWPTFSHLHVNVHHSTLNQAFVMLNVLKRFARTKNIVFILNDQNHQ